jgi:hypothetical protein
LTRRILIVTMLVSLAACGVFHTRVAKVTPPPVPVAPPAPPPKLAQGLWAILDPGCPKPAAANIHQWPACASPVWISHDKATVINSTPRGQHGAGDVSFAADVSIAPGLPVIAQVGTQKDGYLFLALTDLTTDDQGLVIAATGAAVACGKAPHGALAITPSRNGCDGESLDVVREAATEALADRAGLTEAAWIAPGAP